MDSAVLRSYRRYVWVHTGDRSPVRVMTDDRRYWRRVYLAGGAQ